MKSAYLIVVCDRETNAVLYATIWSTPEWEQSLCLDERTYVAYATTGKDYEDAKKGVLLAMEHPRSRYHWLLDKLEDRVAPLPDTVGTRADEYTPLPVELRELGGKVRKALNKVRKETGMGNYAYVVMNEAANRIDKLEGSLRKFAAADLNDGNCASLEVATARIRNLAFQGLKS